MVLPENVRASFGVDDDLRLNQHYEIVSMVAFLIGVSEYFFENENTTLDMTVFARLRGKRSAKIIRNLCILRNDIERNYSKIIRKMQLEQRTMMTMPEYVTQKAIMELSEENINLYSSCDDPAKMLIAINRTISSRINNCQALFDGQVEWTYLRRIFIMPDGTTEAGLKTAADFYHQHYNQYPYHAYMNWPAEDQGNILSCDKKFLVLLYSWNGDAFTDLSRVSDVSNRTKNTIYSFVRESGRTELLVDCENADPYSLCATINNLNPDVLRRLYKIILFDDAHTTNAWDLLPECVNVPVEHLQVNRLLAGKSLVDQTLTATCCRDFYQNEVDSFVLASSDSDYWGLISVLTQARFLVMIEHTKCSEAMKRALSERGIFFCYIDDFYSGSNTEFKRKVLLKEISDDLKESVSLNLNDMLERAVIRTRMPLTAEEKKAFYEKYLKSLTLEISDKGDVSLRLKK